MIRTHIHPTHATAAALVSTLAFGLCGCTVYGPSAANPVGDGEYIAQPRHEGKPAAGMDQELRMPPVPLLSAQRRVHRITSLPPGHWHVTLSIDGASEAKLDAIEAAGVRVKVSLLNLTTGELTVKDGRLLGEWGTTLESWSGTPEVYDALWFRAHRRDIYDLTIEVTPANPSADAGVTATVRLTNDPR